MKKFILIFIKKKDNRGRISAAEKSHLSSAEKPSLVACGENLKGCKQ